MAQTREIKGRIKAVGNIQRITKTMQMIATARFQSMQKKATDAQAYTRKIKEIVGELSASLGEQSSISHPLLQPPSPAVGREKLLVLTSNRGLCGAYNAKCHPHRHASHQRDLGQDHLDIEVVGKKGVSILRFNDVAIDHHHGHFGDNPAFSDVHALAQQYMDGVRRRRVRRGPRVLHGLPLHEQAAAGADAAAAAESGGGKWPVASGQWPGIFGRRWCIGADALDTGHSSLATSIQYDFSPDPETLLAELLPISVKQALYQAFNEAVVSEQLARMVAMKSATDAAGKQQKALKRQYNRARQSAITTEISEIVSGAAALE